MTETAPVTKPAAAEGDSAERTRSGCHYRPNVDIVEREEELTLLADVPGAQAEDVNIDFEDGTLSIHVKIEPRQPENTEYLMREYGVGDYHRTFRVSEAIEAEKITADYADGVLTLHLPKAQAARPRKIAVHAD